MAKIVLDPKKDQLVPIKALKEWAQSYLSQKKEGNWIEKTFGGEEGKAKREKINELNEVIKNLKEDSAKRAWFVKVFLRPFGNKVTKDAEKIFEGLSDTKAFQKLEQDVQSYNIQINKILSDAATNASQITNMISDADGLAVVAANFAKEFNKYNPKAPTPVTPPPAAPAPVAPIALTKAELTNRLTDIQKNNPALLRSFYQALGFEESETPTIDQVVETLKTTPTRAAETAYNQIFQGLTPFKDLPTANINENLKSLMLTKRLYEAGIVDRSEYLAALVITKKLLSEAAAPKAGTPTEANQEVTKKIAGAITSISDEQAQNGALPNLLRLTGALQDALTKLTQQNISESALTPKQKQLAKLYLKKQILTEYAKTGNLTAKTQLNEFFLTALLLSALAGAIAWATSKLAGIFSGTGTGEPASRPSSSKGDPKSVQDTTASLVGSIDVGLDADNRIVARDGKSYLPYSQQIDNYKGFYTDNNNNLVGAVGDITQQLPSVAAPPAQAGQPQLPALNQTEPAKAFLAKFQPVPLTAPIGTLFTSLEQLKGIL